MATTKSNIIANFAGRSISAILAIVFAPIYLRYLGVELYGLIGFFASLQTFLSLLDGGISPTLNRETARLSALPEKSQELKDLSRTLEVLCWILGLGACGIALAASPAAAQYWLNSESIPQETLRDALMLMSVSFAFQWAAGFYTGGLYGLQEQRTLNVVNVGCSLLRGFGSLAILGFVSPTLGAFLAWQLFVNAINCLLLGTIFWRKLPATADKATFRINLVRSIWRYAAGLTGIGIVSLILTQTDKLILSKMVSLEEFGYYSLAITLAGTGIGIIVSSIQTAYFPHFSQLVGQDRIPELKKIYHQGCQVMSFFVIPVVMVLVFFSYDILLVWTRNPVVAERTYVLLSLVAIGTGLNGLMHLPYFAQLAYGITRIGLMQNLVAIVFLVPLMILATLKFGAVGGASCWVILNLGYTIFGLQYMHRIILRGELRDWYVRDVGAPLLAALAVSALAYLVFRGLGPTDLSKIGAVSFIGGAFLATCVATILALPMVSQPYIRRFMPYE